MGLKILAILAFASAFMPLNYAAADYVYNNGYIGYSRPIDGPIKNPIPSVRSISPSSADRGLSGKTITITGNGFVPSSVARVNGSNRSTTFIDYSHLLVQLNSNDIFRTDGFYITVWSGGPGGGYSNAEFFTINNTPDYPAPGTSANDVSGDNSYNNDFYDTNNNFNNATDAGNATSDNRNGQLSGLAANAIFGTDSFLPSGLVQWVLLAIIILVIIIIVRKIFGHEKNYHEAPMKHA